MMTYPVVLMTGKGRAGKDTAGRVLAEEMNGICIALADPIKRFFLKAGLRAEQLWGVEKETPISVRHMDIPADHCKFWLSEALNGWVLATQLQRIDFARWTAGLGLGEIGKGITPRHLMQTFGTECVRSYSPDLWADYGLFVAEQLLAGRNHYDRERGLIERSGFTPPPSVVIITDGRFRNEILKVKARGGFALLVRRTEGTQDGFTDAAKAHASESEQDSIPPWWFNRIIDNSRGLIDYERDVAHLAQYVLKQHP